MSIQSDKLFDHPFIQAIFYAIIFSIPFYRWRHLSDTYEFLKIDWLLVALLLSLLVPYFVVRKRLTNRLQNNLGFWFLLFFGVNVISFLLSPYPQAAFGGVRTLLIAYLFIAITQMLINETGYYRIFPLILIASITICALLAVFGFYFQVDLFTLGVTVGKGQSVMRGVGGSIGANNSALMYLFVLPLLVHFIFHLEAFRSKLLAVLCVLILLAGIVSTLSRGGFLMLIFMSLLIVWEYRHRFHPRYLGLLLAIMCGLLILAVFTVPGTFLERQRTLAEGADADLAMSRRAAYLKVGWQSFTQNPIIGTGPDSFKNVWYHSLTSMFYNHEYRYAHNTYIEVLVGSGLLGLILFLSILFHSFRDYSQAILRFQEKGLYELASLTTAYRLSFICICTYLLILSAIEHKLLLLALAFSQIALRLSFQSDKAQSVP